MLKSSMAVFGAAMFLSGCSSFTPAGLMAAMQLDPLETAPSDINVALSLPEVLRLSDGDAVFGISYQPDDPDEAEAVNEKVPLSLRAATGGPTAPDTGEVVYILGFAEADAAVLAAAQQRVRDMKAQNIDGRGSLSVAVEGGCLTGELGEELYFRTWLRTDPDSGYVPLTRRFDLFEEMTQEQREGFLAVLTPC